MIANETVRQSYAGNNSTSTPYPIPFSFRTKDDIRVVVRDSAGTETTLLVDVDFTVTGAELTTSIAVAPSSSVIIYRRTPATQSSDYVELSSFPAESHEEALDKLTLLAQEARDGLEGTFRVSDAGAPITGASAVASSVLGLDAVSAPIFRTSTEMMTWLSLASTAFNFPTKSWANTAERALAVPDFIGQVGMQRDTMTTYMGTALIAGAWTATTSGGVADGAITTEKLANEVLAANGSGRAKMMAAYLMAVHANADLVSGQSAKTLLDDTDNVLGESAGALKKFSGNAIIPPGSIIQTVWATPYTSTATIPTVIPADTTVPQIAEGTQILSLSITPRFADSKIHLFSSGVAYAATFVGMIAALFRNPISDCLHSDYFWGDHSANSNRYLLDWEDSAAGSSAITYSVRAGPGVTGAMVFNTDHGTVTLGGSRAAIFWAQEIKV